MIIPGHIAREPVDREEITYVDFDAHTPLPARLPSPAPSWSWVPVRALGVVALLVLALIVGHGCGR